MSILFFQGFSTLKINENRQNQKLGSGRSGCESSSIREGYLDLLCHEEVGQHSVLDAKGGEQGGESTGQIKYHAKTAKIKDSEGVTKFQINFCSFQDGVMFSEVKFLFDDEISRYLGSNSPLQNLPSE